MHIQYSSLYFSAECSIQNNLQSENRSSRSRMADWDLTAKIGPYLDRHLVFPLLEFLSVSSI